jgi:hypothetical protein
MALEDIFTEVAVSSEKPAVILCDRGVMDGSAYAEPQVWQAILDETSWSTIQLRDRRYEAVLHMVTAAEGAEEFYTGANNEARYEGIEEARILDKKLVNAWVGHPHLTVVDNKDKKGFNRKVERALDSILKFIGLPCPTSYFKKFLIKSNFFV